MVAVESLKYLSSLIVMEHQQQMNKLIKYHTFKNNQIVSNTLRLRSTPPPHETSPPLLSQTTSGRDYTTLKILDDI